MLVNEETPTLTQAMREEARKRLAQLEQGFFVRVNNEAWLVSQFINWVGL